MNWRVFLIGLMAVLVCAVAWSFAFWGEAISLSVAFATVVYLVFIGWSQLVYFAALRAPDGGFVLDKPSVLSSTLLLLTRTAAVKSFSSWRIHNGDASAGEPVERYGREELTQLTGNSWRKALVITCGGYLLMWYLIASELPEALLLWGLPLAAYIIATLWAAFGYRLLRAPDGSLPSSRGRLRYSVIVLLLPREILS